AALWNSLGKEAIFANSAPVRAGAEVSCGACGAPSGPGWSPVDVALEEFPFPSRQQVHVGDQEPVVLDVEQDLAALAEFLGLALIPSHRETGRGPVDLDVEGQVPELELDVVDPGDPAEVVAPGERLPEECLLASRPAIE